MLISNAIDEIQKVLVIGALATIIPVAFVSVHTALKLWAKGLKHEVSLDVTKNSLREGLNGVPATRTVPWYGGSGDASHGHHAGVALLLEAPPLNIHELQVAHLRVARGTLHSLYFMFISSVVCSDRGQSIRLAPVYFRSYDRELRKAMPQGPKLGDDGITFGGQSDNSFIKVEGTINID